jgi:hypothetical protein
LLRLAGRDSAERRRLLGAVGPFFLGNEVWLVAFTGVLLGIFPKLEGRLFAGAYPVVLAIVLGVIVLTAAVQLRGRLDAGRKAFWDFMITAGASVTTVGWGVLLGAALQGLPLAANGYPNGDFSALVNPLPILCGVLMFALLALHGAAFHIRGRDPACSCFGWRRSDGCPAGGLPPGIGRWLCCGVHRDHGSASRADRGNGSSTRRSRVLNGFTGFVAVHRQ